MIVVDVETSGLDPQRHGVLSIGAVEYGTDNEFYIECRLSPSKTYEQRALKVNGFKAAELYSTARILPADAFGEFVHWAQMVKYRTLANMNVAFDVAFLKAMSPVASWPFGHRYVDLHSVVFAYALAEGWLPERDRQLSRLSWPVLLEYVGLPPEPEPHDALIGARTAARAFEVILQCFTKG